MLDVLPKPLFNAVERGLRERANLGHSGWESASEDEDTLTGDFCGGLRTSWAEIGTDNGLWRWRISYKKFRGRGPRAFEKEAGADGIVQVETHGPSGEITIKGVLFQAKKAGGSSRSDLAEQVRKMEELAPNGSVVFEFGRDGYRAAAGSIILTEIENDPRRIPRPSIQISEYLGGQFWPCKSGLRGMYFDAVRKILVVPADGAARAIPISLRHRVRLEVVHQSQVERAEERLRR
ncbi:MAG: hypothetical protein KIT09_30015 [Bryobacteraceae bacterium]|nr:hypothetical protein [Bryobacteraceae bacterium]